ncbi:MBOAT family O-acyltransferase [Candidatus Frankia nodulisporulans]|uniref:MBOAT family O-acyltransferase n=1 Tax=Candidatus Frankia nodulisporulans TaxID=2060052 RepID=UPI0013D2634F|nr:MBOAT family protein [Candidatus Frankia nodulisporulans]
MIFPTIEFAAFFAVVLSLSWLLMPHPWAWKPMILAASYLFYGYADARFVLLLVASTLFNQTAARAIHRWHDRRILIAAVAGNLGLLGWFKYYGFFALSVNEALRGVGLPAPLPLLQVALPIGISFFTFQAISYVVDIHRGVTAPAPLLDFAVYEAFFPHLVAGPIVRASEFLPQLTTPRDPRRVPLYRALLLILGGLAKKVVLADLIATRLVDPVFAVPAQHSSAEVLAAVYGYAVQIYCDFSAYSDIAIGLALLLGFRFPDNFDRPYAARSLQEFWRRWHMTLSRWLRDHIYLPLGGSRAGPRRTQLNLMITMMLGGLWHGAAWTFVLWGTLHGAALALERRLRARRDRLGRPAGRSAARPVSLPLPRREAAPVPVPAGGLLTEPALRPTTTPAHLASGPARELGSAPGPAPGPASPSRVRTWIGRLVVFHFVCATWVLFRAPDLGTAGQVFARLVSRPGPAPLVTPTVVAAILAGLATAAVPRAWWIVVRGQFARLGVGLQIVLITAAVTVIYHAVGTQTVSPFIYFRF